MYIGMSSVFAQVVQNTRIGSNPAEAVNPSKPFFAALVGVEGGIGTRPAPGDVVVPLFDHAMLTYTTVYFHGSGLLYERDGGLRAATLDDVSAWINEHGQVAMPIRVAWDVPSWAQCWAYEVVLVRRFKLRDIGLYDIQALGYALPEDLARRAEREETSVLEEAQRQFRASWDSDWQEPYQWERNPLLYYADLVRMR